MLIGFRFRVVFRFLLLILFFFHFNFVCCAQIHHPSIYLSHLYIRAPSNAVFCICIREICSFFSLFFILRCVSVYLYNFFLNFIETHCIESRYCCAFWINFELAVYGAFSDVMKCVWVQLHSLPRAFFGGINSFLTWISSLKVRLKLEMKASDDVSGQTRRTLVGKHCSCVSGWTMKKAPTSVPHWVHKKRTAAKVQPKSTFNFRISSTGRLDETEWKEVEFYSNFIISSLGSEVWRVFAFAKHPFLLHFTTPVAFIRRPRPPL